MRTTLTIDDDILLAAKERARREGRSVGAVVSDLARDALTTIAGSDELPDEFFGFRPLPSRGGVITNEMVDQIREEEGI